MKRILCCWLFSGIIIGYTSRQREPIFPVRQHPLCPAKKIFFLLPTYSRSSPCDHSCKRPALVTTSFSYCERFEPRSHFKSRLSLIVRVLVSLLPPVFRISEVDAYELLRCCFDCTRIARRGVRERI